MENKDLYPLFGSMRLRRLKQSLGKTLIRRLPVTRHVFNQFRLECNALWVGANNILNPFFIFRCHRAVNGTNLSVNVGCGPVIRQGWVNVDLSNVRGVSFRYDCRRRLPFRENSVSRIRCEHFFEHLDPFEEAPSFLQSCLAGLQKGGTLRIVVPDAGRYLSAYSQGGKEAWKELGWDLDNLPLPLRTRMDVINHVFRQDEEHRYAYDLETLRGCLERAGFCGIEEMKFGASRDPRLSDDLPVHKPYSLYVEAVKP